MNASDPLTFDPRLLEYLRKKQYYTSNNIQPCIPLEKEYAITNNDIIKIKRYLNRDKEQPQMHLPNTTNQYPIYPPKIQYKHKLHFDKMENRNVDGSSIVRKDRHEPDFSNIIKYSNEFTEPPAFLSRIVKSTKSNRLYTNKNPSECINHVREQYYNNEPIDNDIRNDMILGMPSHTSKAYGYDDSFEHSFDYIDNDIQEPDHVVLPFPRGGSSVRQENKKIIGRNVA
jgi:hypothetical protein